MALPYQLTPYPIGSKREFWTMSWPLMLAMMSSAIMMFVDRLFLSRFEPLALNAAASGGIAYYIFLVLPIGIASISEVLVGRLHGEDRHNEVGAAVWQMVWFSCFLTPLFLLIAFVAPKFLFLRSGLEMQEGDYFRTLMFFAPIQCTTIALAGFFIGIGKVRIVTVSAVLGNLINIALNYVLIFGWRMIPSLGITGAAIATGLSEIMQTLFLLLMILRNTERKTYRTHHLQFHRHFLAEGLQIGAPAGLGHTLEVIAHFFFFQIIMTVSQAQMTIVAMVQSFYILCSFVIEAGSKAASAIVANLLGAEVRKPLNKVLSSSFSLQLLYFLAFITLIYFLSEQLLHLFLPANTDPTLRPLFHSALLFMSLFFLFDGFSWILIGFLTASGDTRFIFWVSLIVHWGIYVLPTALFIGMKHKEADFAWAIVAVMSAVNASIYLIRYLTGAWLKKYERI